MTHHVNRMPVKEAARMFEVSESVFRRMVRNGDLRFLGIFCSEGTYVIPRQAVVKYFAGEKIERRDTHPIPFLHRRKAQTKGTPSHEPNTT